MNPHGFSHLYELFATFTIAYIIIDELSENSFIRQISDKVLKKYNVIQDSIDKVKAKISGHETSIESIPKMNLKDPKVIPGIAESKSTLEAIAYRVKNFDEKINQRIKKNYKTKTFTFLNFYVLLYCLTMLYYGGLFEGLCHKEDKNGLPIIDHENMTNLNNSLLVFFSFSVILLIWGWVKDRTPIKKGESINDVLDGENEKPTPDIGSINGYYKAAINFGFIVIVCLIFHIFDLYLFNIKTKWLQNFLILLTVFLPFSNFIAYFFRPFWISSSRSSR